MNLPLHRHTHWQAPQADTQTKACQRVCLSHPKKKKLKISFPSKNFKNANTQTDTKTFGQLVEKLNIDKGCKTRTTRTPGHNITYTQAGVSCFVGQESGKFIVQFFVGKFSGKIPACVQPQTVKLSKNLHFTNIFIVNNLTY